MNLVRRRDVLRWAAAGAVVAPGAVALSRATDSSRPRIAAIFTEFRFRSHAYNILENFFDSYLFQGELVDPGVNVVSFYADQFPANDMAREVAGRFKIPLYDTIVDAMQCGTDRLAVDGVLLIGEHGDYPYNKLGQKLYPRKRFFDEIVSAMRQSNRFVPVFNDKHLSYRWDWAKEMVETARRHGFPLMAGSSVPLAQRIPELELPVSPVIEEAVSVHGGGIEVYDFHALEVLQSIVEGRQSGESGIVSVQLLSRDQMLAAERDGRWSMDLLLAAMRREQEMNVTRQQRPDRRKNPEPLSSLTDPDSIRKHIGHGLLLTYADGMRAAVLQCGSTSDRWNFACRVAGKSGAPQTVHATAFYNGPWGNRCLFKALSHAIQTLFIEKEAPYPVERTLLVSGVLEEAMKSHRDDGKLRRTSHLKMPYSPKDFSSMREDGSSWQRITVDTIQPSEFNPGDQKLLK